VVKNKTENRQTFLYKLNSKLKVSRCLPSFIKKGVKSAHNKTFTKKEMLYDDSYDAHLVKLKKVFNEDVEYLESLLDKDLSTWK